MEKATLAGGCFWCTEAIFKSLKGVLRVTPGYSGSPQAESVQIEFDPQIISYKDLLEVFFKLHDPTQLNRQGADVGPQYRSAVFFHSRDQEKSAQDAKAKIPRAVTEIAKFSTFFPADESHKDYYFKNRNSPYCRLVIDPKIAKLKKNFVRYLK